MDKYLVIGNPIKHSKSPIIHQDFAKQTNQDISYEKQLVDVDGFENFIAEFKKQGGKGCNVTVPFKENAFSIANELSPRAKMAGAVNTLIFQSDGTIKGDNTDGQGLVGDLLSQGIELAEKRILIIGAGGAARGCMLPILEQKPSQLTITNRTVEKAETLAALFNHAGNVSSCRLNDVTEDFDIIINSTSASLSNELPNIAENVIQKAHCCYDMAYGDEPTCFLNWAKSLGVTHTIDGLGMLIGQAAESFRLWRGVMPSITATTAKLRETVK